MFPENLFLMNNEQTKVMAFIIEGYKRNIGVLTDLY